MRAILVAAGVLILSATASAATLKVPQQYATIQAAVDAAADGDTIKVSKGVYFENVTVNTPNLKILGKKAIIDGTIGPSYGTCLVVNGSNTLVQGFTFRNGSNSVYVFANGFHLVKCISLNAGSYGIYIGGYNDTVVSGCRFYGAGYTAIYNSGGTAAGTYEKNLVQQSAQYGMQIYGSGAVVQKNKVLDNGTSAAIYGSGGTSTIAKNKVAGSDGYGIEFFGNGILVQSNSVSWTTNSGIYLQAYGAGCTVEGNKVTSCSSGITAYGPTVQVLSNSVVSTLGGTGVTVGGDGFTITGNKVLHVAGGDGLYVYNNTTSGGGILQDNLATDTFARGFSLDSIYNATVTGCTAVRCGTRCDMISFFVGGDGNTISGCESDNTVGTGLEVDGFGNTCNGCIVKGALINGFLIYGLSNQFHSCEASGSTGQGFNNGGFSTVLDGGVFVKNRTDITDQTGGGATFSGGILNVIFVTGGETTQPEITVYCAE